jgi:hypothetical protein
VPETAPGFFLKHFLKSLGLPLVFSLIMGGVCYWGLGFLPESERIGPETVRIVGLVVLGAACYGLLSLVFQRKLVKEILRRPSP